MPAFKDPGFQDRIGTAAAAKAKALVQLRARPPVEAATLAARVARQMARDVRATVKRAKARAAKEAVVAAKRERAFEVAPTVKASIPSPILTEVERKAARDARYAARKNRNSPK